MSITSVQSLCISYLCELFCIFYLLVCRVVGYKAGACNHGDEVVTALVVLFSPAPVTLLLIGMGIFHTYPVNERNGLELKQQKYEAF